MIDHLAVQSLALFWAVVCFFRVGAMAKGIKPDARMWKDIVIGGAIAVLVFWLLTDFRGCSNSSTALSATCPRAGDCLE